MTATTRTFLDADGALRIDADMKKSGLLGSIVQSLSARDVALVLAHYIGDPDVLSAVHAKLAQVK